MLAVDEFSSIAQRLNILTTSLEIFILNFFMSFAFPSHIIMKFFRLLLDKEMPRDFKISFNMHAFDDCYKCECLLTQFKVLTWNLHIYLASLLSF